MIPATTPRPRGRPALTDQHREAVLQAARDLLASDGLAGLQARTLARRAGLSVGSIYKLFGDIDELIRRLNRETHREFAVHHRAALDAVNPDERDVMVPLMALARAYIDFVIANERRWAAVLETSQRRAGRVQRIIRSRRMPCLASSKRSSNPLPALKMRPGGERLPARCGPACMASSRSPCPIAVPRIRPLIRSPRSS